MIRRLVLLALLGALLVGCAKATPWPGHGPEGQGSNPPPVNTPNPTQPQPTTPAPGQPTEPLPSQGSIPGDSAALERALSSPSHLTYKIEIVNEPVADQPKYLDERLAKSGPGANELLFVLFAGNNWNLYFGMGPMNPPLSVDQLFAQVKSLYQPKAKAGDPAGGMADLVNALNKP